MTTTLPRRVWAATVGDLLDLALAQPHQVMLSTGSVAIMAQFAAHSGIVDPRVGYCIAVGIEWAYLRGLASAARAPTRWAATLNWSAFVVVVLWGVLWVATVYGALPARPTGGAALWLAVAHVVPIAWLSLCSAMCHQAGAARAAREAEANNREAQARLLSLQAERDRIALEAERRAMELEAIEAATLMRQRLRAASRDTVRAPVTNTVTPHTDAERERLRASIVTLYRDSGETLNVSREAAALGISRGLWYKLRDEAQARGEL